MRRLGYEREARPRLLGAARYSGLSFLAIRLLCLSKFQASELTKIDQTPFPVMTTLARSRCLHDGESMIFSISLYALFSRVAS